MTPEDFEKEMRALIAKWARTEGQELDPEMVNRYVWARLADMQRIKIAFLEALQKFGKSIDDGGDPILSDLVGESYRCKLANEAALNFPQFLEHTGTGAHIDAFYKALYSYLDGQAQQDLAKTSNALLMAINGGGDSALSVDGAAAWNVSQSGVWR